MQGVRPVHSRGGDECFAGAEAAEVAEVEGALQVDTASVHTRRLAAASPVENRARGARIVLTGWDPFGRLDSALSRVVEGLGPVKPQQPARHPVVQVLNPTLREGDER